MFKGVYRLMNKIHEVINVVSKCHTWEFRVAQEYSELFESNGDLKGDVYKLRSFILCEEENDNWDTIYYNDLVAFKNPCERITYIYPRSEWDYRMRDSFKRLDIIDLNDSNK